MVLAERTRFKERRRFIENAFERRFQGVLREARRDLSWHIIGSAPGNGKSMGVNDIIRNAGTERRDDGTTWIPIVGVPSPKGRLKTERTLGLALASFLGQVPNKPWAVVRNWLVSALAKAGSEQIIVDDAHDLTLDQLLFLKELTDALDTQPHIRKVSLCLVCASQGTTMAIRETLAARDEELTWRQFRRRLHRQRPFILVPGLSREELPEALDGLEQIYHEDFPELELVSLSDSIHEWLTHPSLDLDGLHTVTMDNVNKLVVAALDRASEDCLSSIRPEMLHEEAERMALRPNDVYLATDDLDWDEGEQA